MTDLNKLLEECRESLFDIRAFCLDQAKFFEKKMYELEKIKSGD